MKNMVSAKQQLTMWTSMKNKKGEKKNRYHVARCCVVHFSLIFAFKKLIIVFDFVLLQIL